MKLKSIYFTFLGLIFFTSCSLFQKESFEGKWELKLDGDIQEVFEFNISADNNFSFSKGVFFNGRVYDVTVKGNVTKDGKLQADLIVSNQKMGIVEGTLTYENGNGKWDATYARGNWTALKK